MTNTNFGIAIGVVVVTTLAFLGYSLFSKRNNQQKQQIQNEKEEKEKETNIETKTERNTETKTETKKENDEKTLTHDELFARLRKYDDQVDSRILGIFQWGSRVYGTNTPISDFDFMIVATEVFPCEQPVEKVLRNPGRTFDTWIYELYDDGTVNATFVTLERYLDMIQTHRLEFLETLWLPKDKIWDQKMTTPTFTYDKFLLRPAGTWESARTFQKAKRKIQSGDVKKGKKELFHAMRYLVFAIQIAQKEKIYDYSAANMYWDLIKLETSDNWEHYKSVYTPTFQQLQNEFKQLTNHSSFYSRRERGPNDNKSKKLKDEFHVEPQHVKNEKQQQQQKQKPKQSKNEKQEESMETNENDSSLNKNNNNNKNNNFETSKHPIPTCLSDLLEIGKKFGWREIMKYQYEMINRKEFLIFRYIGLDFQNPLYSIANSFIVDPKTSNLMLVTPPPIDEQPWTRTNSFDWKNWNAYVQLDGMVVYLIFSNSKWRFFVPQFNENSACWKDPGLVSSLDEYISKAWNQTTYSFPKDQTLCLEFNLLSQKHRYVVKYDKDDFILSAAYKFHQRNETNKEDKFELLNVQEIGEKWRFRTPTSVPSTSLQILRNICEQMNPFSEGGFLLVDNLNHRVNVRPTRFMCISLLGFGSGLQLNGLPSISTEGLDQATCLDLIRNGENYVSICVGNDEKWAPVFQKLQFYYDALVKEVDEDFRILSENKLLTPQEFIEKKKQMQNSNPLAKLFFQPSLFPTAHHYLRMCDRIELLDLIENISHRIAFIPNNNSLNKNGNKFE